MGCRGYEQGFKPTPHPWVLDEIEKLRKPRKIFLNSMGDLFHKDIPDHYINQVWKTIFTYSKHRYIILTKRPERLLEWTRRKADYIHWPMVEHEDIWPDWIWLGVSVESQKHLSRIDDLLKTQAAVKIVSFEPLLEEIIVPEETMKQLSWVIVGAETGPRARYCYQHWINSLWWQTKNAHVPFFFKQWSPGQEDDNGYYAEVEATRQFPEVK